MDVKLKLMFLGWKSGLKDDGSNYYQGQFLDTSSNQTTRLYFTNDNLLKSFKPYSEVTLNCKLYINQKGLWSIKVCD